ncbi:MAG: protein PhnA [Paracoccaceae bacterium]|jgi:protein PhnA
MICPLCTHEGSLAALSVEGGPSGASVDVCDLCKDQIAGAPDPVHWRGLATAMWSEQPEVQVMAVRMLRRLSDHDWARDLLDQLYLDPETRIWADNVVETLTHRDANGVVLARGDTVVLIKDLTVKGAGFTAKRGTAVRSISLVADNAAHIEGRVEGQRIVILTEFVKKKP